MEVDLADIQGAAVVDKDDIQEGRVGQMKVLVLELLGDMECAHDMLHWVVRNCSPAAV